MKNFWIVFEKEYLTRVRQKTFIISTIITPLIFILLSVLPVLITSLSSSSSEQLKIWVIDSQGLTKDYFKKLSSAERVYEVVPSGLDTLKSRTQKNDNEAILVLPESFDFKTLTATLYSSKAVSISQVAAIKNDMKALISEQKLKQANVSLEQKEILDYSLDINTVKLTEKGEEETSSAVAAVIGYIMGLLIYMFLLMYGTMVMRSVIEEKANRIMEIIVSTVKPFQLMLGKIFSVGAIGLTQFIIWIAIIFLFQFFFGMWLSSSGMVPTETLGTQQTPTQSEMQNMTHQIHLAFKTFKISLIFHFIFYFLGGYVLYGSLFAALGAMVDQESDAQQLSFIVILPVILPILFIGNLIQDPNGGIAVFLSIFPFFSSITMMIRLAATDVSWIELILSQVVLIGTVIGIVWISARIFRVGILLYGKKYSLKDAAKWIFYKD